MIYIARQFTVFTIFKRENLYRHYKCGQAITNSTINSYVRLIAKFEWNKAQRLRSEKC